MFCCLSTLVIFWFADRLRGLDFDPMIVTPCVGEACTAYVGPVRGSPWSVFTDMLEPQDVTVFSGQNMCGQLASTLEQRGAAAQGVDQIIDLMTTRGTLTLTPGPQDGTLILAPGARNDGFGDALRDSFSFRSSRGCFAINYKPVFWPLWLGWMLLASLRMFRGRQQEWAKR